MTSADQIRSVSHELSKMALHETKDELLLWAAERKLIIGSLFFWNMGSALQKPFEGLLRSLLHDILTQPRRYIPKVAPIKWRELVLVDQYRSPWTIAELKNCCAPASAS